MPGCGLLSLLLLCQAAAVILQQLTLQDPVKNIEMITEDVKRTIPEMPVPDLIRYWGYPVGGGGRGGGGRQKRKAR